MKAMGFPSIYKQSSGLMDELGDHLKQFGKRPLLVMDEFINGVYGEKLIRSLKENGIEAVDFIFKGEVSNSEIERIISTSKDKACDCVVGVGGGKVQDVSKSVKLNTDIPLIIVPTVASNDAATSRLIITYSEDGEFVGPKFLSTNPDAVLVDSSIIAKAPVRFLVAGIGDALATYYEANQCILSGANNFFGGKSTEAAYALANLARDLIVNNAQNAIESVNKMEVSEALEKVIEANVLLSGLGFEGCGVAAAHAISQGFTLIKELNGYLHGEEVAVGLVSQWFLENKDQKMIEEMLAFFDAIELPFCLADLGLSDPTQEELQTIANYACRDNSRIYNMSIEVTPQKVIKALSDANQIASSYRNRRNH
jgi:glycerol dehydrogenase